MSQQRFIANPVPKYSDLPYTDPPGTVRQVSTLGTMYRCVEVQWLPEDGQGNLQPGVVDQFGNTVAGGGTLTVNQFNSGTNAGPTTFWCGDMTWKTPPGGSSFNPSNSFATTANAMSALVIDTSKTLNFKSIGADMTFTFSGAPPADTWFSLHVNNTDSASGHTLTIPSSFSIVRNAMVTKASISLNQDTVHGDVFLTWYYDGTTYYLRGDQEAFDHDTGDYSTKYGYNAGSHAGNPVIACDFSVFMGYGAGASLTNGLGSMGQNVIIGYNAANAAAGYALTAIGYQAAQATGGPSCTMIGYSAGRVNTGTTGLNCFFGVHAGENATNVGESEFIGYHAGDSATGANQSVFIGRNSGYNDTNATNCVYIGHNSGGANRAYTLYIDAANTVVPPDATFAPLVYGEFDTFHVSLNGGALISGTTKPAQGSISVASAALEVRSTVQGFLLPRMTKAQRNSISSPVAGLAIFQTDNTPGQRVYNGTNWMRYTETAD